jgi:hypothetical protein
MNSNADENHSPAQHGCLLQRHLVFRDNCTRIQKALYCGRTNSVGSVRQLVRLYTYMWLHLISCLLLSLSCLCAEHNPLPATYLTSHLYLAKFNVFFRKAVHCQEGVVMSDKPAVSLNCVEQMCQTLYSSKVTCLSKNWPDGVRVFQRFIVNCNSLRS